MKRGEDMEKKLHNVKIIGDGEKHHIIIDGKDESYGILEATLKIEPCKHAKVEMLMKSDVEISCIELQAEVETEIEKPQHDEELERLCKAVSDHLFNNPKKYSLYVKAEITGTNIEIVEVVQGIPIKRY